MSSYITDPKRDALTEEKAKQIITELKKNLGITVGGNTTSNSETVQQEEKPPQQEEQQQDKTTSSKGTANNKDQPPPPREQNYAYLQAKINNTVAQFQNDRIMEIAKAARKDKHIIFKFEDNPSPPKLGERKANSLTPIDVYYSEIPNEIHEQFKSKRARILDLQVIKSQMSSSVDNAGNVIPAVYTKNDPQKTGLSDKVFLNINSEIEKLETELSELMALWYFGIDKDLIPKLENSSLQMALEAGLYREKFGIVSSSKNSAVF